MLFRLLKNVSSWVYDILLDNNLADKEARLYFGDDYDSNKG
jgi:hypothetical protein